MSGLRVRDLWDSTHCGPESQGHVKVRHHPWDGLVDNTPGWLASLTLEDEVR